MTSMVPKIFFNVMLSFRKRKARASVIRGKEELTGTTFEASLFFRA